VAATAIESDRYTE